MNDTMEENKDCALSDEQLEEVTGGTRTVRNMLFYGHVGKYDGIVGQRYYVVYDDFDEWFYGTMLRTYEADELFHTRRTHLFSIILNNGYNVESRGITKKMDGDTASLYTDMKIIE